MRAKLAVTAAATVSLVMVWAGVAGAHVTVSPSTLAQGTSDAILTFRVPNESDTAAVTGLRIQFPRQHPITVVSPEAGSGWSVTAISTRLPTPITTDDGTFTSTVSEVDWSGGTIPVGQFGEFNVLAQGIPSGTDRLVFKTIQQYGDGTTVSWIQIPDSAAPDPPHPAPVVVLTASGSAGAAGTGSSTTAPPVAVSGTVGGTGNGLAVAALIAAGFAVVLAVLAVWLGRPRLLTSEADEDPEAPTSGDP
jgi:uncharacterized protein YcnI